MGSFSLEMILRRARGLCVEAGLDPDEPSHDGRPEWFRFLGQARTLLQQEQENQSPLEALKALPVGERARPAHGNLTEKAPDKDDPVKRLQELFEREASGNSSHPKRLAREATNEMGMEIDSTEGLGSKATHVSFGEQSDPLEILRALEAASALGLGLDEALELASLVDGPATGDTPAQPQETNAGGSIAVLGQHGLKGRRWKV